MGVKGSGRKRKPTRLKKITGNAGKRKLNHYEPELIEGRAACPHYFKGEAAKAFRFAVDCLENMQIKTAAFQLMLESFAFSYGEWRALSELVDQHGRTFETITQAGDTMYRSRPEVAQRNEAWKQVKASLSELGLTPTAISRHCCKKFRFE
ncbi:P27 family phage terminase small subunit [Piscirickettsia salmonis]|uniref:P27 family phage terminase small subunit n=1 Tax=Piscirickettsia salmonis TaxID=1238 RepID=UPI0012BAA44C|nr:P27 family phage terminase small subunit [Piscirickettsia salmonis]QGP41285.1 putative phage terminase, small subunit, P27 family [Piscirickettsia salmonis]